MKKNMTRISAILMAAMMASGVAITPVFAEEKVATEATTAKATSEATTTEATTEATTTEATTAATTTEKKPSTTEKKPSTTEKKPSTTEKKPSTTTEKKDTEEIETEDVDNSSSDSTASDDDTTAPAVGTQNITAPEETKQFAVPTTASMISKIQRQIEEKQSLYDEYNADVSITEFYKQLAVLNGEHGVTMDMSLTGIKKEKSGLHTSDSVDILLSKLANQINNKYIKDVLKEYTFQVAGEVNVSTAMTGESDYLNIKPYIDKMLSKDTKPLNKKKAELKKLKEEIESLKKDLEILKKNQDRMFNPMNLLQKSNLTTQELQYMLKGSALESLASSFKKCEDVYGVNAVFVASIAIHESAWGTSRRAREDNNLTGYGVTSDSAVGINAQTKEQNLLMTAKLLKEKYLVPEGAYYHGPSVKGVNQCYCVGNTWAGYVTNYAYKLMDRLQSQEQQ